jgi:hypothetical protein
MVNFMLQPLQSLENDPLNKRVVGLQVLSYCFRELNPDSLVIQLVDLSLYQLSCPCCRRKLIFANDFTADAGLS